MKEFYLDVEVIEKRRLRVQFNAEKKPTNEEMKSILDNDEYYDITDEECLKIISVEKVG